MSWPASGSDFWKDATPERLRAERLFFFLLCFLGAIQRDTSPFFSLPWGQIYAEPGDALLFYNVLPDGNLDDRALHAGRSVEAGTKVVANVWLSTEPERGSEL